MGLIFYTFFLYLFRVIAPIVSLFNPKAKKWVNGRRNIFEKLEKAISGEKNIVWVHCASLGEFEQGRPLIEKIKEKKPDQKTLLTFFSPSGYEMQKNYAGADWVFYLPMDGPGNAKRFLKIVQPALVLFIKYELWYYYLKEIYNHNIHSLLVSAHFTKDKSFFKWYGGLQRKMLSFFSHLFVQNKTSQELMEKIGLGDITSISGDTRFDRVLDIAGKFKPIEPIEKFCENKKTIVAGSTWIQDEELLAHSLEYLTANDCKLIIAPHEINQKKNDHLLTQFPHSILYSSITANTVFDKYDVLIIDNIGMLSRLYHYAFCCYVGGGFHSAGIHNVLEAAVYYRPVFFGPNYKKHVESIELVKIKAGIPVADKNDFIKQLNGLITNGDEYKKSCMNGGNYVKQNAGAVNIIINYIQEKRLLMI